jgi:hypothetical protein
MGAFRLVWALLVLPLAAWSKPQVPLVAPPTPPPPVAEAQPWADEPGGAGVLLRAGTKAYDVGRIGGLDARFRIAGGIRLSEPATTIDPALPFLSSGVPWVSSTVSFSREIVLGLWLDFGVQSTRTVGDVLDPTSGSRRLFHETVAWVALRL